jgi:hypothetical protein
VPPGDLCLEDPLPPGELRYEDLPQGKLHREAATG